MRLTSEDCIAALICWSQSEAATQSASVKAMICPLAARTPRFLAAYEPGTGCWSRIIEGKAETIAEELSLELLSTKMIS